MAAEAIVRQLRLTHFLRGLDEAAIGRLSQQLELQSIEQGDTFLAEGQPPPGLWLVHRGRVQVLRLDEEGKPVTLAEEEAGGALAIGPLLRDRASSVSLRALEPTELLFWPKRSLFTFLEANPAALESLQVAAESHELRRSLALPWIADDEAVFAIGRRHPIRLALRMILPTLLLAAGSAALWWSFGGSLGLTEILGLVALAASAALGLWQWLDWRNDYYVVTDQRVVWMEKVIALYDSRVEAPLHQVLSVSVTSDVLGRWLGYGDVVIRTFTGQIEFLQIGRPRAVAAIVEERWRRLQIAARHDDRAEKLAAVRQLLAGEAEAQTPVPPTVTDSAEQEPEAARSSIGLNHWNFELRFEEQGVISYRKHWAVLLGAVALPSILFLLAAGWAAARLAGLVALWSVPVGILVGIVAALASLAWWAYQYADWANDLYQVSPTHILDVYRRPLGRELRRAAPLENILSTEVDRRGIIGIVLDFGDVRVNVGAEQLDFEGVFHPRAVQQDVVRAQEAFLAKKRQTEQQDRRDEMVEWLGVYHDELSSRNPDQDDDPEFDVYP